MTVDEMVGWHHQPMGMSLGKLRELVMNREAWRAAEGAGLDTTEQLDNIIAYAALYGTINLF